MCVPPLDIKYTNHRESYSDRKVDFKFFWGQLNWHWSFHNYLKMHWAQELKLAHKVLNVCSPSWYQVYRSHRVILWLKYCLPKFLRSFDLTLKVWKWEMIYVKLQNRGWRTRYRMCVPPLDIKYTTHIQSYCDRKVDLKSFWGELNWQW